MEYQENKLINKAMIEKIERELYRLPVTRDQADAIRQIEDLRRVADILRNTLLKLGFKD